MNAGFVYMFLFMAFISVQLGVLNLLPIPVLDGGQILILCIEGIKGSPLSDELRAKLFYIGAIALLGLTALVFWNDIVRFIIQ